MRKGIFLVGLCMLFLNLTVLNSFAFFLGRPKVSDEECLKSADEFAKFVLKNLYTPFSKFSKEEENFGRAILRNVSTCKEKIFKAYRVPYSRRDWSKFLGPTRNPADKVSSQKFTIILPVNLQEVAVGLKGIYKDALDVAVFWTDFSQVDRKFFKEENKPFCYVEAMKIICPAFHLEKELGEEMMAEYYGSKEVLESKKSPGIPWEIYPYELLRKIIPWLEKEFGPNGRSSIPSVLKSCC